MHLHLTCLNRNNILTKKVRKHTTIRDITVFPTCCAGGRVTPGGGFVIRVPAIVLLIRQFHETVSMWSLSSPFLACFSRFCRVSEPFVIQTFCVISIQTFLKWKMRKYYIYVYVISSVRFQRQLFFSAF